MFRTPENKSARGCTVGPEDDALNSMPFHKTLGSKPCGMTQRGFFVANSEEKKNKAPELVN
jgi:hypothetical protein